MVKWGRSLSALGTCEEFLRWLKSERVLLAKAGVARCPEWLNSVESPGAFSACVNAQFQNGFITQGRKWEDCHTYTLSCWPFPESKLKAPFSYFRHARYTTGENLIWEGTASWTVSVRLWQDKGKKMRSTPLQDFVSNLAVCKAVEKVKYFQ